MILADTSLWVDHLRNADTPAAAAMRDLLTTSFSELATCEPITMELIAGGPPEPRLTRLTGVLDGLPVAEIKPVIDFRAAALIWRSARAAGLPVRSLVDCLIAAVAIRHGALLVHKDRDYEVIATVSPLRQRSHR